MCNNSFPQNTMEKPYIGQGAGVIPSRATTMKH